MLCHIIPRDNLMRFCVVLLCAAFILQAVALARRTRNGSAGTFLREGVPPIYVDVDIELHLADGTTVCSNSDGGSDHSCRNFVKYMRVSMGFAIASFISTPIAMAVISAAIVPLASTTMKMVVGFWLSVWFPFLATILSTAIFFEHVVPEAAMHSGFSSSDFERGISVNLFIASCSLHCFSFLLATLRLLLAVFLRPAMKREMIQSKNIDSIMILHMVNDDWDRQKKVWVDHAEHVCAAIEIDDSRMPVSANEPVHEEAGARGTSDERPLDASSVLTGTASSIEEVATGFRDAVNEPVE